MAHYKRLSLAFTFCGALVAFAQANGEQQSPPTSDSMDNERLENLLRRFDPDLKGETGQWLVTVNEFTAQIITDENANRMRIIIPLLQTEELTQTELYRLLQANFESALDARYAIAQGLVWSTFIHPLSSLTEEELISAMAQTFNAAATYGTTYSSGLFHFRGGDNRGEIFDEIIERGTPL